MENEYHIILYVLYVLKNFKYAQEYTMCYFSYFSELHNFGEETVSAIGLLNYTIRRKGLPTEVGRLSINAL